MSNENKNNDMAIRSKAWKNFLSIDKDIMSIYKQIKELHEKAQTAQNLGDVNSWQEFANKIKSNANQIISLQMQQQRRFIELIEIVEVKSDFCFN